MFWYWKILELRISENWNGVLEKYIEIKKWVKGIVNMKDENNMEILEINIINNGKIEKNKLFLSEIEDEI